MSELTHSLISACKKEENQSSNTAARQASPVIRGGKEKSSVDFTACTDEKTVDDESNYGDMAYEDRLANIENKLKTLEIKFPDKTLMI